MHAGITCAGSGSLGKLENFWRTGTLKIVNSLGGSEDATCSHKCQYCCIYFRVGVPRSTLLFWNLRMIPDLHNYLWNFSPKSSTRMVVRKNKRHQLKMPKESILCLVSWAGTPILCKKKLSAISIPLVPKHGQLVCLFIGIGFSTWCALQASVVLWCILMAQQASACITAGPD